MLPLHVSVFVSEGFNTIKHIREGLLCSRTSFVKSLRGYPGGFYRHVLRQSRHRALNNSCWTNGHSDQRCEPWNGLTTVWHCVITNYHNVRSSFFSNLLFCFRRHNTRLIFLLWCSCSSDFCFLSLKPKFFKDKKE